MKWAIAALEFTIKLAEENLQRFGPDVPAEMVEKNRAAILDCHRALQVLGNAEYFQIGPTMEILNPPEKLS